MSVVVSNSNRNKLRQLKAKQKTPNKKRNLHVLSIIQQIRLRRNPRLIRILDEIAPQTSPCKKLENLRNERFFFSYCADNDENQQSRRFVLFEHNSQKKLSRKERTSIVHEIRLQQQMLTKEPAFTILTKNQMKQNNTDRTLLSGVKSENKLPRLLDPSSDFSNSCARIFPLHKKSSFHLPSFFFFPTFACTSCRAWIHIPHDWFGSNTEVTPSKKETQSTIAISALMTNPPTISNQVA